MQETLYIIDAHSQIHRAWHSPMRGILTSPSGEPTKATFLFTTQLVKLLRVHKPTYIMVAFDGPRDKTFRSKIYPTYKANRGASDPELSIQIRRIREIVDAIGLKVLYDETYEADDIIGTMANDRCYRDLKKVIISRDKDLNQLLRDQNTWMFDPQSDDWMGYEYAVKRWGVEPELIPFVQAMCGDVADNIKGLEDVGPKTAAKMALRFETPAQLLASKDLLPSKIRSQLTTIDLELNLKLTKTFNQVPIDVDLDDCRGDLLDMTKARHIFRALGFSQFTQDARASLERFKQRAQNG